MSYRKVAVHGVGWLSALQAISAISAQLVAIIIARLLAPLDFGVFGLAMIAISLIAIPGDLGLSVELVRRPDYLELVPTALKLRWLIAVVLTAITIAVAPAVSIVAADPAILGLVVLLAAIFPAAALGFGPRVALTRALNFKSLAIADTVGRISGPLVSLGFALIGAGYWSLAYGMVFSSWATPVLLVATSPVSPKGAFKRTTAASLVSTGKFVSISTLFGFLLSTGDNMATVAGFGVLALGFYAFGYSLAVTISRNVSGMVETIVFPIFSKIVDDPQRVKQAYLTTLRYICYFAFPIAFAFLVFSGAFVEVILGQKWQPVAAILPILAFAGLCYSIAVPASSVLLASGLASRVTRALAGATLVLAAGLGFALILRSFQVVAIAAALAALIYLGFLQTNLSRHLSMRLSEFASRAILPGLASGIGATGPFLILWILGANPVSLALAVVVGVVAYLGIAELLSKGEFLQSIRDLAALIRE